MFLDHTGIGNLTSFAKMRVIADTEYSLIRTFRGK